jgi:hypothetical protein
MAKLTVQVQLKKDDGTLLGSSISAERPTKTEALSVIAGVIQSRVDAAQQGASDLVDAQNAFNS